MTQESALELLRAQKVRSIEMPLSAGARVFIILDGEIGEPELAQLHRVVDTIRDAYFPRPAAPVGRVNGRTKPNGHVKPMPEVPKVKLSEAAKAKLRRWAKPCPKHPDSPKSPETHRCLQCATEAGVRLMAGRVRKRNQQRRELTEAVEEIFLAADNEVITQ